MTAQNENGGKIRDSHPRRTRALYSRLTETEHARVLDDMKKQGLSLSALARKRVLEKCIATSEDLTVLAELRRLGAGLKRAYEETGGVYSDATAQAIKDISAYIRCLTAKRYGGPGNNSVGP